MFTTKLFKLVTATALAVTALGAAPFASAGLGMPQKHPDGQGTIIGVLKHPDIIGVLNHRDIIGVLKHPDFRIEMRKAGGDPR
jgi:hypothetical protein